MIEKINGASPQLPYIIDPSCGSGTFLIDAMKIITQSVLYTNRNRLKKSKLVESYVQEFFQPSSQNKNIHNRWAREFIYGVEDNEDLAMATKVNMILHGDGNANIEKGDGLADFADYHQDKTKAKSKPTNHPYKSPINEAFDFVVSNPPFSLKEDERTLARYDTRFAYAGRKNSENLFIERWYQLLKEGGRLGVVLPDSVFDTNENLYIRLFLYRFFLLKVVVSLPQVTFQPYTPTKTSLLFAQKKTREEVERWDAAWRKAANEYGKLRQSEVIKYVLMNHRLRDSLIDLAYNTDVEWYPTANLLNSQSFSSEVRGKTKITADKSDTLRKRHETILEEYDEFLKSAKLEELQKSKQDQSVAVVRSLLRDRWPHGASKMSLTDLLEATYDEIVEAAELNYTEEPKGRNYCNAWWCFSDVSSKPEFNATIYFGEATQVGYKRTIKHREGVPQPNDLFSEGKDGHMLIDTAEAKTILDVIRGANVW